jgi:hypothetical protein
MAAKNTLILSLGLTSIVFCWVLFGSLSHTYLEKLNPVADIINAATAPMIAFLAAFLVYVSFREQVKANQIQSKAINEQRELDLSYRFYEELKVDLQRMQTEYGTKYQQTSMLDSLMNYVKDDRHVPPYPEFNEYLFYLYRQLIFISKRIARNKVLDDSEIVYLIEKVLYLYKLYFQRHAGEIRHKELTSEFSALFKLNFMECIVAMDDLQAAFEQKKEKLRSQKRS